MCPAYRVDRVPCETASGAPRGNPPFSPRSEIRRAHRVGAVRRFHRVRKSAVFTAVTSAQNCGAPAGRPAAPTHATSVHPQGKTLVLPRSMPRSSSTPRRRQTKLPWAPPVTPTEDPTDVAPPAAPLTTLGWVWPLLTSAAAWVWRLALPLLTLLALVWLTGAGHWVAMFAYNGLECHRATWVGLLWAPLDQGRPECVLLWRLANLSHWSLFDLFGKVLTMLVPSA